MLTFHLFLKGSNNPHVGLFKSNSFKFLLTLVFLTSFSLSKTKAADFQNVFQTFEFGWGGIFFVSRPDKNQAEQGQPGGAGTGEWRPQGRSFCFCSANVCLLPDSLARFNNLSDTQRRARELGKRIRNGASRPQIKIYIDSPTNTSIR